MGDRDEEVLIDIPENLDLTLHRETCIYRVRPSIRRHNEEAYTPRLVGIGPYHYDKPEFQKMEIQKLRYLKLFCGRIEGMTEKQVVNHLSLIVKECEEQIRHCYDDPCELGSTEFVKMIVLDSIFIIELALRDYDSEEYEDDVIIGAQWTSDIVVFDLCLTENQLPYFIIKRLYKNTKFSKPLVVDKSTTNSVKPLEFDELIFSLFSVKLSTENKSGIVEKVTNFLDLFRYEILDRTSQELKAGKTSKLKYNASKLHAAGVKFKAVKHDDGWRLDVKFSNGVLKIPVFELYSYNGELFIQNLMEFEQLHHPWESYIGNYVSLLDNLINTSEDVDILVDAGIVLHWHGSNELFAEFINKLCKGMGDFITCYDWLYDQLNKHYENNCNHLKATLKLVYFSNLWRGTGTVAAAVLLLLTLLQTISSVKSL